MAIELAPGTATPMEASGSAEGLSAPAKGETYEQITEGLKRGETGAETTEEVSEPEETKAAPAKEAAAGEDELRLMTDEEIAALPQELQREVKSLKKRLLGAYTQKTQQLAELRRKADFSDRLQSDESLQRELYQRLHQQFGQQPPASGQPPTVPAPAQYVQLRKQTLPAELQWMAESLAQGDYQRDLAIYQGYIQPLQGQLQDSKKETLDREYKTVETAFAERNPGWDAHEDTMVELLDFLKAPTLTHPTFGNKLELLYRVVTGDTTEAKAVQKVFEKTAEAARARSVTSSGGRSSAPNLEQRIRDRKLSDAEAWALIQRNLAGKA